MAKQGTFSQAIDVTFKVGLETNMGERIEYDEDGDPYPVGTVTFADIIAEKAAALVAVQYREQIANVPSWKFDPVTVAEEAIDDAVGKLVSDTITRVVSQTDTFGQQKGEPQTIAEILSARIEKWLVAPSKPTDSYSRSAPSNIEVLVSQVINRDTTAAIKKATDEARAEVLAKLKSEQTEALAGAVESLLRQAK